jgi:hypothetical protein
MTGNNFSELSLASRLTIYLGDIVSAHSDDPELSRLT